MNNLNLVVTEENKDKAIELIKKYNEGSYIGGMAAGKLNNLLEVLGWMQHDSGYETMHGMQWFTFHVLEHLINDPKALENFPDCIKTGLAKYICSIHSFLSHMVDWQDIIDVEYNYDSNLSVTAVQEELDEAIDTYDKALVKNQQHIEFQKKIRWYEPSKIEEEIIELESILASTTQEETPLTIETLNLLPNNVLTVMLNNTDEETKIDDSVKKVIRKVLGSRTRQAA